MQISTALLPLKLPQKTSFKFEINDAIKSYGIEDVLSIVHKLEQ